MVRGEHSHDQFLLDPTAHLVSWPEPAAAILPPLLAALQHYLGGEAEAEAGDEFMMYEFKVRLCARARAHDWTACPYAHPGEVARRRDPSRLAYSGEPCPDYRRCPGGACPRGPSCPFAHGTFELWLHPARYRTRPCRAGIGCRRRVCFFAHAPGELRAAAKDEAAAAALSPKSTLAGLWESPPVSPVEGRRQRSTIDEADVDMEVEELMLAMRELSVRKAKTSTPQMPVLPPATEEDGPDFGWVSELLM